MSDDGAELTDNKVQHLIESQAEEESERRRIQAAIDARPLDVYDIAGMHKGYQHAKMSDHWYWCRHHRRPEHVGWAMDGCVRVGPFMSEREANRLQGSRQNKNGFTEFALGPEVER